MNIQEKLNSTLNAIKGNEALFANKVKQGSEKPMDFYLMAYYSGLHNGFSLVFHALDKKFTEAEYDEAVLKVFQNDKDSVL